MTTPVPKHHREALVATLAVAWALFGSRWGSYVGFPPLFLTDVLIALALAHWTVTRAMHPGDPPVRAEVSGPHPALLLFLVWSVMRLAMSMRLDLVALRDAAPYLYAVVGVVSALALRRATPANLVRTTQLLYWTLYAHAVWSFIVFVAFPALPDMLPLISQEQGLPLLRPRSDFDTPVVAIFATWVLVDLMQGRRRHRVWSVLLLLASWITVFASASRAGLLGAIMVGLLGVVAILRSQSVQRTRQALALAILPLVVGAVVALLPQIEIGQRIAGTFGSASTEAAIGAGGTADARAATWEYLVAYSAAEPSRFLFGVGHGPNFMSDTGAGRLLVGSAEDSATNPRSPHNYWLGTLLREGIVGVALFGVLVLAFARRAMRLSARMADDPLILACLTIPVGLLLPATFGVVLEAPFGAVPFFWALGIILAIGRRPWSTGQCAPVRATYVDERSSAGGSRIP